MLNCLVKSFHNLLRSNEMENKMHCPHVSYFSTHKSAIISPFFSSSPVGHPSPILVNTNHCSLVPPRGLEAARPCCWAVTVQNLLNHSALYVWPYFQHINFKCSSFAHPLTGAVVTQSVLFHFAVSGKVSSPNETIWNKCSQSNVPCCCA